MALPLSLRMLASIIHVNRLITAQLMDVRLQDIHLINIQSYSIL
jgi:hypothetical protein